MNKIGEKLEGVAYEMDGFRAYHVIEVNKIELKYLFFVLIPNDDYDEMGIDMTIYKENDPNPLKKCLND